VNKASCVFHFRFTIQLHCCCRFFAGYNGPSCGWRHIFT